MSLYQTVQVPVIGEVNVPVGIFIDNEWSASSDQAVIPTINPADGKEIVSVSHATGDDVDRAVKAARRAFTTTWGVNVKAVKRAELIFKLADLMEKHKETLGALESLDSGKGIRIATGGDVGGSIDCLRYYAGLANKYYGQTINHYGTDKFAYTVAQPIGVCGQIIPWNYPLMMWAWKVAPALAAGCCVVMKPSELTPLTALYMCNLVKEAGFPPGVLNTVPGLGSTTGSAIAHHMDIDKVAFTGSVPTGRRIQEAAARSNLKKVTLELGGKSPILVFDSADLEDVANWVALGIWYNSGQDCTAGSRVYIQDTAYDSFISILKTKAAATKIGQPFDQETSFGPLISRQQRDKVISYIVTAKRDGAELITGGGRWSNAGDGFWVEPTILGGVTPEMSVSKEEIFGPVIIANKFSSEAEALGLANNTIYGLAAAVFSNDAKQAKRVAHSLDAGTVWINQYCVLDNGIPFGGFKQSGIGRELGSLGLEAYLQIKSVHENIGQKLQVSSRMPIDANSQYMAVLELETMQDTSVRL